MADILRMIVVLSALCGLSGFALSYLKMVTAPVIEEQVLTYVQGPAIAGVFTDIDNQPIADRKAFETEKGRVLVFPAMRDGKLVGVALEAKGKGYGGDVGVMVGFNVANDTLAGIGTTTLKETPGLGMRIAEPGFTGQFRGIAAPVGLKSQGGSIDGISGATISPDTTLGLDEIGLPEETAWRMYSPFVMRRLAQIGYTPLQAREAIEEKSPAAVKALKEDMDKRPVIVNRAPTLWRHGIMAAKPLLRSGKNLRVNSIWEKGLNADYDGDAMQIHLPVSDEAIKEAKRMFPSRQLFTDKKAGDLLQAPTREPIIGLYKVTENVGKPQGNAKVHRFPDVDAAWKAYYAGKLKMTDYVDIG